MKLKNCYSPDCDNPLTGKQRKFCSRACAKRFYRGVQSGEVTIGQNGTEWTQNGTEWDRMGQNRPDSEVKPDRTLKIRVTMRITNRHEMEDFDQLHINKVARMRLKPILERFFRENRGRDNVRFQVEMVSEQD